LLRKGWGTFFLAAVKKIFSLALQGCGLTRSAQDDSEF
jgi:hypothetical protein